MAACTTPPSVSLSRADWALMLLSIYCCARGSCLTTYCPLIENLCLPPPDSDSWDADGNPTYVDVLWLDWKSRLGSHRNNSHARRMRGGG